MRDNADATATLVTALSRLSQCQSTQSNNGSASGAATTAAATAATTAAMASAMAAAAGMSNSATAMATAAANSAGMVAAAEMAAANAKANSNAIANANNAIFARRRVNPRPLPLSISPNISTPINASTNTSTSRKRDRNDMTQASPSYNVNTGVGVGVGLTMNGLNANLNGNVNINANGNMNMNASSSIEGPTDKKKTTYAKMNKPWLASFDNLKKHKEETGSFDIHHSDYYAKKETSTNSDEGDAGGDSNVNVNGEKEKEGENGTDTAANVEISKCTKKLKKLQKLKRWVAEQKQQYRNHKLGKESTMSDEKLKRFSEIGFEFSDDLTRPPRGRKPVPDIVKADRVRAAAAAAATANKIAASKPNTPRGETKRSKEKWDKMYAVLQAYHATHGDCDVPRPPPKVKGEKISANANDDEIGDNNDDAENNDNDNDNGADSDNDNDSDTDSDSDRSTAEKGVDSTGINSDLNPTAKPNSTAAAAASKTPEVKVDDGHNRSLYNWITAQRFECRKLKKGKPSKMTAHRMLKLNELGFNFRLNLGTGYLRWPKRLEKLRKYKETHGHLNIPVSDVELGSFVRRARVDYAKFLDGNTDVAMNEERVKELEALGFVFTNGKRRPRIMGKDGKLMAAPSMTWQERFEELLAFKDEYKHCLVPQKTESGLGHWVHKQRSNYKLLRAEKKSPMNADKALKLTEAGFVFETHRRRSRKVMEQEREREKLSLVVQAKGSLNTDRRLSYLEMIRDNLESKSKSGQESK